MKTNIKSRGAILRSGNGIYWTYCNECSGTINQITEALSQEEPFELELSKESSAPYHFILVEDL